MTDWANWGRIILMMGLLIPAAIIDVRTEKVPNRLTLPMALAGLIFNTLAGAIQCRGSGQLFLTNPDALPVNWSMGLANGLEAGLVGLFAAFVPFFCLFMIRAIHGGDVKTITAVGAITASPMAVMHIAFWALAAAAAMGIIVMFHKRIVFRTCSRIWGALLMLAAGSRPEHIDAANSQRIPYAVAFAIGGLIGGIPAIFGWHVPFS